MRSAILGAMIVGSLLVAGLWGGSGPTPVFGDGLPAHRASKSHELVTFSCPASDGKQQLTVIDPETKVMGVYHVNSATGEIVLKSVRTIYWDLQMVEYCTPTPTPAEIRSLLERK